jgi:DNA-binding MarR family transcriptional regulator
MGHHQTLPTREILDRYASRFPNMQTDVVDEALHMLRHASVLMRKLEAYFAGHGLSQTRFLVLIVLEREPSRGSLLVSEIADRLDVSRPVVTQTLRALQTARLVRVTGSKEDARSKSVTLTNAGREKLTRLLPGYYDVIQRFMATREA